MKNEKTRLFVFWLGEKELNKDRFINKNFELTVGPSADDHEYLMSKYPYYKKSFELKKYAFCADVWRFYILSKFKGLYIDTSVKIGENVELFLQMVEGFDAAAFRGNYKYIETGVLWSGKDNNEFYESLLKKYCVYESMATFIMPIFFSKDFFENGFSFGWEFEARNNIALFPLTKIRDKKTIWKTTGGSWGVSADSKKYFQNVDNFDGWKEWEYKYVNKIIDNGEWNENVELALCGDWMDLKRLRMYYDNGNFGVSRKELRSDYKKYKKEGFKIKIIDRLIWSMLYVFFTMKWLSNKNLAPK